MAQWSWLGKSSITRASPHSDSWAVNFRFQDAQSLVLLHIRATTSKREVQLVPGKGKSTRKFLLGTPNQCHLCGSNASVLMDVEARITSLSVVTADIVSERYFIWALILQALLYNLCTISGCMTS